MSPSPSAVPRHTLFWLRNPETLDEGLRAVLGVAAFPLTVTVYVTTPEPRSAFALRIMATLALFQVAYHLESPTRRALCEADHVEVWS